MKNYLYRTLFENRLLKSDGNEFEKLCSQILKYTHGKNFTQIRPYGNLGDRKNDGYLHKEGIFFQIYGPETLEKQETINRAISKLKKDFVLLKGHVDQKLWPKMKEFNYIINDKGNGTPLKLAEHRDQLSESEKLAINILTNDDIKKMFFKLSDEEKNDIIGSYIPSELPKDIINLAALKEVIEYLVKRDPILPPSKEKLIAPNFEEKIKFNKISLNHTRLLKQAEYQLGYIEEFLDASQDDNILAILRDKFSELYNESKTLHSIDTSKQFEYIYTSCLSGKTGTDVGLSILSLMSYFFSSCDIFEEPLE